MNRIIHDRAVSICKIYRLRTTNRRSPARERLVQLVATQTRTQPAGMPMCRHKAEQAHMTGARAATIRQYAIPFDARGEANQQSELPPVPVGTMGMDRDARGSHCVPVRGALPPVHGSECHAAGLHVGAHENRGMTNLSVPAVVT